MIELRRVRQHAGGQPYITAAVNGRIWFLSVDTEDWPADVLDMLREAGAEIVHDTTPRPLDPLTCPGWYELDDRTWQEFVEHGDGGDLIGGRVVQTHDAVLEARGLVVPTKLCVHGWSHRSCFDCRSDEHPGVTP
jgi:hypothetical protein